jgi:hypothetical protein
MIADVAALLALAIALTVFARSAIALGMAWALRAIIHAGVPDLEVEDAAAAAHGLVRRTSLALALLIAAIAAAIIIV